MPIVDDYLTGRLDEYRVTIYDTDNIGRSILENVELLEDVNIRYGKLERSATKGILPSYVQLGFTDESLNLFNELDGGFKSNRYVVEIISTSTTNVKWRGLIKEKTRIKPFSTRTSKETITLNCYGGITEGRIGERGAQNHGDSVSDVDMPVQGAYMLSRATKQIPITAIGNNGHFGGGELIKSNLRFLDWPNFNWHKVGDNYDLDIPQGNTERYATPLSTYQTSSFYKAVKEFNKIYKYVLYKSLSEGKVVWQERNTVGKGFNSGVKQTQNWPTQDDYTIGGRGGFVNTLKIEDLIEERDKDGLKDLRALDKKKVIFETDENVLHIGSQSQNIIGANINTSDISVDYNKVNTGPARDVKRDRDSEVQINNTNTNNKAEVFLYLGQITPKQPIRIQVDWLSESDKLRNIDEVKIVYQNAAGDTATDSSPLNSPYFLTGPSTTQQIDPYVRVQLQKAQGSPTQASEINIRARYLTDVENIVEELVVTEDEKGIEPVEIEDPMDSCITRYYNDSNSGTLFDVREFEEAYDINNNQLNVRKKNSHLFRQELEGLYRPPGTKTARFKTKGVFGPEWVHKIEDNQGNVGYYIASGLSISLSSGITDMSLVEIPPHELS